MFPHLPAPIGNYNIPQFANVIPVFFHQSLLSHQSSNPFRIGKFRSTSFSSSWWHKGCHYQITKWHLRTAVIRNWMILANCSYSELNTFVHYTWPAKVIWFQRTEEGNAPAFYHALGRTEVTHETNVREFHFGVITCQPSWHSDTQKQLHNSK